MNNVGILCFTFFLYKKLVNIIVYLAVLISDSFIFSFRYLKILNTFIRFNISHNVRENIG
jgi:hypothetical protein